NLRVLDLSHNQIMDEGAKPLTMAIQEHPNLEELNLSHNPITEQGARVIIKAFQQRKLTHGRLNLSHIVADDTQWNVVTVRIWMPRLLNEVNELTDAALYQALIKHSKRRLLSKSSDLQIGHVSIE